MPAVASVLIAQRANACLLASIVLSWTAEGRHAAGDWCTASSVPEVGVRAGAGRRRTQPARLWWHAGHGPELQRGGIPAACGRRCAQGAARWAQDGGRWRGRDHGARFGGRPRSNCEFKPSQPGRRVGAPECLRSSRELWTRQPGRHEPVVNAHTRACTGARQGSGFPGGLSIGVLRAASGVQCLHARASLLQICEEVCKLNPPHDMPVRFSHIAVLFAIDTDHDGRFSMAVRTHMLGRC